MFKLYTIDTSSSQAKEKTKKVSQKTQKKILQKKKEKNQFSSRKARA